MDKESQRQNDAIERDLERAFNDIRGVVIQTSEAVQAVTLKAVGEAIHKGHKVVISLKPVTYEYHLYEDEIEALRQGKMPAEWEGR